MYLEFYSLKKLPFHITPDPEFLFMSPSHEAALEALREGVETRQSFATIIGDAGSGKTTLLRAYLEHVEQARFKTMVIFHPDLSFPELLHSIYRSFGLKATTDQPADMVARIHQLLLAEHTQGRQVAFIIDNAHDMPVDTLAHLPTLVDGTALPDPGAQLVLIGQPTLAHKLSLPPLRVLQQRITVHAVLTPLTEEEGLTYVAHRLAKVASQQTPVFTQGALRQLVRASQGSPQTLNGLCSNALIAGFEARQKPISVKVIKPVIRAFKRTPRWAAWRLVPLYVAGFGVLAGGIWLALHPWLNPTLSRQEQALMAETRGAADIPSEITPPRVRQEAVPPVPPDAAEEQGAKRIFLPSHTSYPSRVEETAAAPLEEEHATEVTLAYERYFQYYTRPDTESTAAESIQEPDVERLEPLAHEQDALGDEQQPFPVTRIVRQNDSLWQLALDVYGEADTRIIQGIQQHNPHIANINRIEVGDALIFPDPSTFPDLSPVHRRTVAPRVSSPSTPSRRAARIPPPRPPQRPKWFRDVSSFLKKNLRPRSHAER